MEIDRHIGYIGPDKYFEYIKKVIGNKGTMLDMKDRVNSGERSSELLLTLAKKYQDRNENALALEYYTQALEGSNISLDGTIEARFFIASQELLNGSDKALWDFIKMYPDSYRSIDGLYNLINFYLGSGRIDDEVKAYNAAIEKLSNDPMFLNAYAWRMGELEKNLDKGLDAGKQALSLEIHPIKKSSIYDTVAELFWKLDQPDSAVWYIDRAIEIDSSRKHFILQKQKFINR